MPKQFISLAGFGLLYFGLLFVLRGLFSLEYAVFLVGGLVGLYLPFIDAFVYVYVLRPHEVSSQRVASMIAQSKIRRALSFIAKTNEERSMLIFHNALFQCVFATFAFLVMSSSSNLLGRGLVLGFLLHYLVLQGRELVSGGDLGSWFSGVQITLTQQTALFYWLIHLGILVLLGFSF